MTEPSQPDPDLRLAIAELRRSLRRWKTLSLLALAGVSLLLWFTRHPVDRIKLRSKDGTMELTATTLRFWDADGAPRTSLLGAESTLHLSGPREHGLVILGVNDVREFDRNPKAKRPDELAAMNVFPGLSLRDGLDQERFAVSVYPASTEVRLRSPKFPSWSNTEPQETWDLDASLDPAGVDVTLKHKDTKRVLLGGAVATTPEK